MKSSYPDGKDQTISSGVWTNIITRNKANHGVVIANLSSSNNLNVIFSHHTSSGSLTGDGAVILPGNKRFFDELTSENCWVNSSGGGDINFMTYGHDVYVDPELDMSAASYINFNPSGGVMAMAFNGTNSRMTIAQDSDIEISGNDWSMAGWVYFDRIDADMAIIERSEPQGNRRAFRFLYEAAGNDFIMINSSDGTTETTHRYTGIDGIVAGIWYFWQITYDVSISSITMRINDLGKQTFSGAIGTANLVPWFIGVYFSEIGNSFTQWFEGRMCRIVQYQDKLLSDAEFDALYNSGNSVSYGSLSAGQLTDMSMWLDMDKSQDGSDSHGDNDWTPSGLSVIEDGPPHPSEIDPADFAEQMYFSCSRDPDNDISIRIDGADEFVTNVVDNGSAGLDDATQSTPANQPNFNTVIVNGISGIECENSRWLNADPDVFDGSATGSLYLLIRRDGWDATTERIFTRQSADTLAGLHLCIRRSGTTNNLQLLFSDGVSNIGIGNVTTAQVTDQTPFKLALTWSSNGLRFYMNTTTPDISIALAFGQPTTSTSTSLGGGLSHLNDFSGAIFEIWGTNTWHSALQVEQVFNRMDRIYGL